MLPNHNETEEPVAKHSTKNTRVDPADIIHSGALQGLSDYTIFRLRHPRRTALPERLLSDWHVLEVNADGPPKLCLVGRYRENIIRTSPIIDVKSSRTIITANCIYKLSLNNQVHSHPLENDIHRHFLNGFPHNWNAILCGPRNNGHAGTASANASGWDGAVIDSFDSAVDCSRFPGNSLLQGQLALEMEPGHSPRLRGRMDDGVGTRVPQNDEAGQTTHQTAYQDAYCDRQPSTQRSLSIARSSSIRHESIHSIDRVVDCVDISAASFASEADNITAGNEIKHSGRIIGSSPVTRNTLDEFADAVLRQASGETDAGTKRQPISKRTEQDKNRLFGQYKQFIDGFSPAHPILGSHADSVMDTDGLTEEDGTIKLAPSQTGSRRTAEQFWNGSGDGPDASQIYGKSISLTPVRRTINTLDNESISSCNSSMTGIPVGSRGVLSSRLSIPSGGEFFPEDICDAPEAQNRRDSRSDNARDKQDEMTTTGPKQRIPRKRESDGRRVASLRTNSLPYRNASYLTADGLASKTPLDRNAPGLAGETGQPVDRDEPAERQRVNGSQGRDRGRSRTLSPSKKRRTVTREDFIMEMGVHADHTVEAARNGPKTVDTPNRQSSDYLSYRFTDCAPPTSEGETLPEQAAGQEATPAEADGTVDIAVKADGIEPDNRTDEPIGSSPDDEIRPNFSLLGRGADLRFSRRESTPAPASRAVASSRRRSLPAEGLTARRTTLANSPSTASSAHLNPPCDRDTVASPATIESTDHIDGIADSVTCQAATSRLSFSAEQSSRVDVGSGYRMSDASHDSIHDIVDSAVIEHPADDTTLRDVAAAPLQPELPSRGGTEHTASHPDDGEPAGCTDYQAQPVENTEVLVDECFSAQSQQSSQETVPTRRISINLAANSPKQPNAAATSAAFKTISSKSGSASRKKKRKNVCRYYKR